MKKNYFHRYSCRLCGSRKLILAFKLTSTPLADEYIKENPDKSQSIYPVELYLCTKCKQVQLGEVIPPEIIYREYIYETVSSLGLVKHFGEYAGDVINQIYPSKGSLVIDIGSNDGTLLKVFKAQGMKVLGVDPARLIANAATKLGIETIPEFFTPRLVQKIKGKYGPATIITANNLYANVDNLDEFTLSVKELLMPNGVFILESFYLLDLMENMVFDFIYHEHLSYFTVKPLQAYFKRHGMELIDIKHIPTKGGSLRYTVQLMDGPRRISPSVAKQISLETKFGIHKVGAFKSFSKRIDSSKKELLHLLAKLKKKRKIIAGYGASATTTTLLYHFNLTDRLDFIIDDYPRKQNTFSPGCHIPVFPPSTINKLKPDYILILAWRYFQPIVKKHQEYLKRGGQFIIPLPSLKIIKSKTAT